MALPNGAGGYQLGDGNLNETTLGYGPTPSAYTADLDVVLTVAELEGGIILYTQTATSSFQLPLVTGVGTVTVNTGWTLVGSGATPASGVGAHFRARKTADGAWSLYRLA